MKKPAPTFLKMDGKPPAFKKTTEKAKGSLHGRGVRIAVALSTEQFAKLRAQAISKQLSIAAIIREHVDNGLKNEQNHQAQ